MGLASLETPAKNAPKTGPDFGPLLWPWTPEERADYGEAIQIFPHRLEESGLFTDEALAALLERHPGELIDVCTMVDEPDFPARHCTVDPRGCSGEDLINLAKAGAIWINIREAMNEDPAYAPLMAACYRDLADRSGRKVLPRNRRGGILVSSPAARVPYHCDPTQTLLWHVRGRKRVYVYPRSEAFLPDEAYEAIVLGERDQDVPYREDYDREAQVFDLEDGSLVCWPHTSPHRVENQSFCVSMVMECSTPESILRNSVMYTNGLLRRRFGRDPSWSGSHVAERAAKSVLGHVLRKAGAHRGHVREDWVGYRVDLKSHDRLIPVPAYIRDF